MRLHSNLHFKTGEHAHGGDCGANLKFANDREHDC